MRVRGFLVAVNPCFGKGFTGEDRAGQGLGYEKILFA